MKVILLEEVKGKGGEGDVVEVARGFAVNYLLPNKMAVEATSGNLKQLEQRKSSIQKREEARINEATEIVGALDGKQIVIQVKLGDGGRLYGSVTPQAIAEAIQQQLGVDVDRRRIDLRAQIKEAGEHPVAVQVYRDISALVTVVVTGDIGSVPAVASKGADVSSESAEAVDVAEAGQTEDDVAPE